MAKTKVDQWTPQMIAAYAAGYAQWQQRNLEVAFEAFKTEYCVKAQTEMAQAWRKLEDDRQSRIFNDSIKTFMREHYVGVKLLSPPSIYAKMIEVFDTAVFLATEKCDWL